MDTKKKFVRWTFKIKPLKMLSTYEMEGKFLLVPIVGKGKSNITLDEGTFVYSFNYTFEKRKGVDHIKINKPQLTYNLSRIRFNFENLFNGDKTLGDGVNQMLNDNWKEVNETFGPALAEAVISVLNNFIYYLAKALPYNQIILPGGAR